MDELDYVDVNAISNVRVNIRTRIHYHNFKNNSTHEIAFLISRCVSILLTTKHFAVPVLNYSAYWGREKSDPISNISCQKARRKIAIPQDLPQLTNLSASYAIGFVVAEFILFHSS